MNGDFIYHNLPVGKENASNQQILNAWALMKNDMQNVFDILRSKNQISAILPSIGNNDVVVHNHVPCDDIFAQQYYLDIFNIWFPKDNYPINFNYT